ncbi:MAG: acetyl-CoA carboxylase biotin carboxylase subunit [Spirochaetes bacterium]|nr:acetyl-CoA carboxylase biotin carboxylase subunit [Spirochaetota bacterium]
MFSKILIANRGEIAVRIIRACKEMGIATVAVFSEADRNALHVNLADESYCIGAAPAADSYLNMSAIITAAVSSGASAIHPGYGFLSENTKFAALCEKCNITFIGPGPEVIEIMGDKDSARRTMKEAGVPVIPGTDILKNTEEALEAAREIGFPVLLKARSGGGGRGIRLVEKEEDLEHAFNVASAEAIAAFSDGAMYMEKFLYPVKHVEAQVLCDKFGNALCLGERECSVQRRNQKLIEESPSPAVSEEQRKQIIEVSRKAALASGYVNAGTIEFLLADDGEFYFMEMNTRLQVEHGVTEMVTGIDIVKWQIRIAAGLPLTFKQEDILLDGSAIECRINAENPRQNFRPSCGKIELLHFPAGPWVRVDSALYQNYIVPPFYDSLVSKILVFAKTREEAIRKMRAALCELVIEGIDHNADFLCEVMSMEEFENGSYHVDLLSKKKD